MSRFSPTVAPQNAPDQLGDLGHSVAGAIDSIRARRKNKKDEAEADADRTRRIGREDTADAVAAEQRGRQQLQDAIGLYNAGYRTGQAPTGAADVGNALEQQRGNLTPGQSYSRQREPAVFDEQPGTGRSGGFTEQPRGNQVNAGWGGLGPEPGARANQTQGSVATLLDRQRSAQGPAPQASAPPEPEPVHPMTQLGQKYYQIPGQQGYLDLSATPDARAQALEASKDAREFGQSKELEGVKHGYKGEEEATGHGYKMTEQGQAQGAAMALERERTGRAERVAGIRAGAVNGPQDPTGPKTLDARSRILARQIGDTRAALNQEGEELSYAAEPDSTAYHGIAERLDSLRGVSDEVAAARGGGPDAQRRIMRDINHQGYTAELSTLTQQRDRLIAKAKGDPALIERINAAFGQDTNGLSRKYSGALGPN